LRSTTTASPIASRRSSRSFSRTRETSLRRLRRRDRIAESCVVAQLTVGAEEPAGPGEEGVERRKTLAALGEERRLGSGESLAHGLGRARRPHDRSEQLGIAGAARRREGVENRSDLLEPGKRQQAVADLERSGFARLGEEPADRGLVRRGAQRQNRRPSGRRAGQCRNEPEDDADLESFPVGAVSVSRAQRVARRSSESLRSIFLRAWIILRLRFALGFS
jgi:hypothetical protein